MFLLPIVALLAALPLQTQTFEINTFEDPVFEFTMPIPEGMALRTPEQLAAVEGLPAETYRPITREESPEGKVSHTFQWGDTTALKREVRLLLQDNSPPFLRPERFSESITNEMGLTVDINDSLTGAQAPGMYLEGTRTAPDGTVLRVLVAYLPGQTRYAIISFMAPADDWAPRQSEFMAMLESVTFNRPQDEEMQQRMAAQRAASGGSARPRDDAEEGWDSLAVTGSLVLAGLLVMGLFLGGRSSS